MTWLARLLARSDPPERQQAAIAAALLSLPCPLCAAPAGTPCDPWSERASLALPPCGLCRNPAACPEYCDAAGGLTVLGADPLVTVHAARVLTAIAAGLVPEKGVSGQYAPGREPHSLRN